MSALPPIADIQKRVRHVRFVPKADIGWQQVFKNNKLYFAAPVGTAPSRKNKTRSSPLVLV
jgi:hypothetical protein